MSFDSAVFKSSQADRAVKRFEYVAALLCGPENMSSTLLSLATASFEDLAQIWSWNATVPEAVDSRIHDILLPSIRSRPEAVAIQAWDGNVTYAQLVQDVRSIRPNQKIGCGTSSRSPPRR